jgi:ATP-dependent Clp protease ATP-binding subunit ClpC
VVIGRDKEIEQILQILSRKKKNNPIILGDPGVGKTSLVESLAQKIVSQKVPGIYRNQRILSLDLCSMISGTKFRGDIEQKLQKLFSYIEEEGNIILFIDEIQQLFGKTGTEAPYLINLFKPYLNNCRTRILCTCDLQEYRKKVEKDSTFLRRFQPVVIGEPSPEETYHILEGIRPSFEKHHLVHISNDAVDSAVKLSTKYILGRYQPDQAIDLLDETCAHYCYTHQIPPDDLLETRNQIEFLEKRISHKQKNVSDVEKEKQLLLIAQNEYLTKMNEWRTEANKYIVSSNDVAKVVSQWTNIPMGQLLESEKHKLMNIETELKQNIIGQDPALKSLANALRRSRLGIKDSNKPTGIFLFLGPTGVGKTETARVLAEYLFGTRTNLIRFDMSEYMEKHAVSRLIGAPPGYIGYEEGGQLTEAIKRKPYSILLFDEIEKAHSDIFNIWLQLFDDGRLTDAKGFTVDCSNCIVVLTSNIVHNTKDGILTVGFTDNKDENNDHESNLCLGESFSTEVNSKLKKFFKPELLNRLDEIVVFNSLSHNDLLKIINIMIKNICSDITTYNIELVVTDKAKNQLVEEGYHQDFGARPLRRVLQKRIVDELSLAFVENKIHQGDTYKIDFDGNQFEYNTQKEETKQS